MMGAQVFAFLGLFQSAWGEGSDAKQSSLCPPIHHGDLQIVVVRLKYDVETWC